MNQLTPITERLLSSSSVSDSLREVSGDYTSKTELLLALQAEQSVRMEQLAARLKEHMDSEAPVVGFVKEMQSGLRWTKRILIIVGTVLGAVGTVVGIMKGLKQ